MPAPSPPVLSLLGNRGEGDGHKFWMQYNFVRSLMTFNINVYFRSIDILHYESFPSTGPVILIGNHANQFVDGFNLVRATKRPVRMLIAQKSYDKRVVGDVAKLMGNIPVLRPQDRPCNGKGKLVKIIDEGGAGFTVVGEGCNFTTVSGLFGCDVLVKGCKIKAKWSNGTRDEFNVREAPTSDNELKLNKPIDKDIGSITAFISPGAKLDFKILPKIDQKIVYNKVIQDLDNGGCIGIFPEGGSHDQGHLIPLKAGVAIMALAAAAEDVPVKLVCAGMTYFHAHRFRSKALIQYGNPFSCPPDLIELNKTDPKKACNQLLIRITKELKMVTTNTTDHRSKKIIQTIRRLYQPNGVKFLTGEEHMQLNKKFVIGFERVRHLPQAEALMGKVGEYIDEGKAGGWKDKELKLAILIEETQKNVRLISYCLFHLIQIVILTPIVLPSLILNGPIMAICKYKGKKHQAKALAASSVKVGAFDVIASEVIKTATVFTLPVYLFYTASLAIAMGAVIKDHHSDQLQMYKWLAPILLIVLLVPYGYVSVYCGDQLTFSIKKLLVINRTKIRRKTYHRLRQRRIDVQVECRSFARTYLKEGEWDLQGAEQQCNVFNKGGKSRPQVQHYTQQPQRAAGSEFQGKNGGNEERTSRGGFGIN
ncbi:hypothetical protein ScalyP_jg7640 [Parmales sp. scaly parma]|nr:hypothetical protein ScalyP_jg7640 [Parmales sp. scaly parma]